MCVVAEQGGQPERRIKGVHKSTFLGRRRVTFVVPAGPAAPARRACRLSSLRTASGSRSRDIRVARMVVGGCDRNVATPLGRSRDIRVATREAADAWRAQLSRHRFILLRWSHPKSVVAPEVAAPISPRHFPLSTGRISSQTNGPHGAMPRVSNIPSQSWTSRSPLFATSPPTTTASS